MALLAQQDDIIDALASSAVPDQDPLDDWYRLTAEIAEAGRAGYGDDATVALDRVRATSANAAASPSGVVVTTIHKAKGLEWRAVALADVDDKSFKSANQEDRLLLYVAITRVRNHLAVFSQAALATLAVAARL